MVTTGRKSSGHAFEDYAEGPFTNFLANSVVNADNIGGR